MTGFVKTLYSRIIIIIIILDLIHISHYKVKITKYVVPNNMHCSKAYGNLKFMSNVDLKLWLVKIENQICVSVGLLQSQPQTIYSHHRLRIPSKSNYSVF